MSDQLAAFPLTFNWQIAKQTHEEHARRTDSPRLLGARSIEADACVPIAPRLAFGVNNRYLQRPVKGGKQRKNGCASAK